MRRTRCLGLVLVFSAVLPACGDDEGGGLADYFPPLPPTGGAQGASAGEVTDPAQLVPGPAQSGMVGDFFIKNDKVTFIVQAPTRVLGVIPQGGNVVDAVLTDGAAPIVQDHFGELSLFYLLGRTCEPDRIEIVRDGSAGGPAVLRAIGASANNDFINVKGIGFLPVDEGVDPDIDDNVSCATTYILEPGATTLQVHHSLYNNSAIPVEGPMGLMSDSGGDTDAWTGGRGFERADISAIASLGNPAPIDYVLFQGPGVAYGLIPRHATTDVPHSHALIAGVSVFLNGTSSLLEVLQRDKYYLRMQPKQGYLQSYDLVVGADGADVDAVFRAGRGEATRAVSGRVDLAGGAAAVGARVGVYLDRNSNGVVEDMDVDTDGDGLPDDRCVTYLDVAADGTFAGEVPADLGALLLRAELEDRGRSPAQPAGEGLAFTIPAPLRVDYEILDAATGQPIPGRLLVVGDHVAFPDQRLFSTYDRVEGVVQSVHALRGTTVDLGDGADPALLLPAGGTYRIYASRGTEWSIASQPVTGTANADLTFTLRHVNPTPGYLATDWHVHQVNSPDSPVLIDDRLRAAVSAGVEMFAATDHDFVSDLQPDVERLGVQDLLRVLPGIEVTPFVYGHFNAWPMTPDDTTPNRGAVDWARGMAGFNMMPGEIYGAMRERGARMIQVNHARYTGFAEFQGAWSRANLKYDFDARTIFGDYQNANVPNDWLRLPGESLWSDQFTAIEVWNGFGMSDSNSDGLRENIQMDRLLRDWFSMLSLGLFMTPTGNSDTHTLVSDAVGMPRTYVRVPDDSGAALASGAAVEHVLLTQTGASATPRDIVVTNGPMIDVEVGGMDALGRAFPATGAITLTVTITSPDWAAFDTLEVFANATLDPVTGNRSSVLVPLKCWTSRTLASLNAMDPCAQAPLAAEAMNVQLASLGGPGGFRRHEATVTVTLDADDIVTRAGATGRDAWLVFRVRGDQAVFPIVPGGTYTDATKAALLAGDLDAIRPALTGLGVPAAAFTTPVFVDFDGGGYRAPFAP